MIRGTIDWTHKRITINDIRKLTKLYVIKIHDSMLREAEQIESGLFVKDTIFEERLKSYFLKEISQISRDEILNVLWNFHITKGYYIKINDHGDVEEFHHDPQKWYVSYLEIDGPLGTFSSIYRDKELNIKETVYNTRP